ncbi:MAG: GrpB family protein [Clostridia bacterium]|nr:GrpB family protein [Clostridia bacterium]
MLGLKRGEVALFEHQKEWEIEAQNVMKRLKGILGDVIVDIQHVGSTSIPSVKAKPIIDIAVAVNDFDSLLSMVQELKINGFYHIPTNENSQLLFACGSYYDGTGEMQTHFIHIVLHNSMEWINYINFRDYLNNNFEVAKEYEALKISLSNSVNTREEYTEGKRDFIDFTLRKALVKSYLGKTVHIKIDRPIGYVHKKKEYSLTYPINYGYIPNVFGGDGEELDVYLLGVNEPVLEADVKIIGVVHRENDVEDKLIAAPVGTDFSKTEIENAINFQEQYYKTYLETE